MRQREILDTVRNTGVILSVLTLMAVPSVLLTSNIVKFLTKFSSGSGVKLLQGYMLRAS